MEEKKKNNTLAYGLLLAGGALGAYALFGQGSSAPGTSTLLPANGTLNLPGGLNWTNSTGAPVIITATGQLVNAAGNLMGDIASLVAALQPNGSGGYTGGNANPDSGNGSWQEQNDALVWVPNVTGTKRAIAGRSGYYYNPLPGALM